MAPIIGHFDMDGSLADYEGQLLADLKLLQSPQEPDIVDMWNEDKIPHIKARTKLIKSQPGWWLNLPPIAAGMKVFAAARDMGFDCRVLTKGPHNLPQAWAEKLQWCAKHLGTQTQVQITMDKGTVYGRFLYDDFTPYCEAWLKNRPRGLVIMPDTPHNRGFVHPQAIRYTEQNFDEVVRALRLCLDREDGEPLEL